MADPVTKLGLSTLDFSSKAFSKVEFESPFRLQPTSFVGASSPVHLDKTLLTLHQTHIPVNNIPVKPPVPPSPSYSASLHLSPIGNSKPAAFNNLLPDFMQKAPSASVKDLSAMPNLLSVEADLALKIQSAQSEARLQQDAWVSKQLAAAKEQKENAPLLTISKQSFFRDTSVGRGISSTLQGLSGSTKDGMPYSHLGNYFPSPREVQDAQLWPALLTGGLGTSVRLAASKLLKPAMEIVDNLRASAAYGQKVVGRPKNIQQVAAAVNRSELDAALTQYGNTAARATRMTHATGAAYVNAAGVSAAYGLGSNWYAGDPLTFKTAMGSAATGLFLAGTGPTIINAASKVGLSDNLPFSSLVAYRSGVWGGYGLAATGDAVTALSMAAGGGLLTWAGPAMKSALASDAGTLKKAWDMYSVTLPLLAPGIWLTGKAKGLDNVPPTKEVDAKPHASDTSSE